MLFRSYPVDDPQAVRNPRPDFNAYWQSGNNGLQLNPNAGATEQGYGVPEGGSRVIQWGWAPVGGSRADDASLTPNYLASITYVGNVIITVT